MDYEVAKQRLAEIIRAGQLKQAIAFINTANGYDEGETMVSIVLHTEACPQEVIEAALERFVATRENRYERHGYWVHSLSHFTEQLWKRGLKDWIKRLNTIAFTGANELDDTNCSDRLLGDFERFAPWDAVPAEYGYSEKNLRWAGDGGEYTKSAIMRLRSSPFKTEAGLIRFELGGELRKFTKYSTPSASEPQATLLDLPKIRKIVEKLKELGDDVSDLKDIEARMLGRFIDECEQGIKSTEYDWKAKDFARSIKLSREMLAIAAK